MSKKQVIAIDLGAESGRVIRVGFDGERIHEEVVHRFPNIPVEARGTLHWDVLRLWHEIQEGIKAAGDGMASLGLDTWGVDFALLDRDGALLGNPVHYRDNRHDGMYEWVFERVPRRTVFERTGTQFMIINSLYQLASLAASDSAMLKNAGTFLSIPDLFNYWLCGDISCEWTHVSTSQLYNPIKGDWDFETIEAIGVPTEMFPKVVQPGTQVGEFNAIPVIKPATHDTASAVVAVPTTTRNYAYLSSGTWSLIGLETTEPVINGYSYEANVTNEGGAYGTFRLLKNVSGLWTAQQCRAAWSLAGDEYSWEELTEHAKQAEPFRSLIDPDDDMFLRPGDDMAQRIQEFCRNAGQPVPESVGQIIRTIYESLALKYRVSLDKLIALADNTVDRLHIIGGGSQNELLCQMTADAIARTVVAGPVEATSIGNALVQLITLGEIGDLGQAREMLSKSVATTTYEPEDTEAWEEAYQRYKTILTTE